MTFETWLLSLHPQIPFSSAQAVLDLTKNGATVPFIARYRKEATGNLDEVAIQNVIDAQERWDQVLKRQAFIVGQIEQQRKLTPELKQKIESTFKLEELDDLYLPYKQKRKTKAANAREAGLEPLADWIWNCGHGTETPEPGQTLEIWAFTFRNEAKEIKTAEAAIAGAQDILTERISEIQDLRQLVRTEIFEKGTLHTTKSDKAKPQSKFITYFEHREPIHALLQPQNSHRYLAMKRGATEEELVLKIEGPADDPDFEARLLAAFENMACPIKDSPGAEVLKKAAQIALKGYVLASIENEAHRALKEVADATAIQVFSENLKKLLLASPMGPRSVLGVDPGIRTGCKLAVVDETGKYIASTVVHCRTDEEKEKAKGFFAEIVKTGGISAVAVGNGTGGRDVEHIIRTAFKENEIHAPVIMVNEAGASVYSASENGREEFPDLDATVRGAISIARRLQDPLAELVKIDPKSIGVGQYQHDVSAPMLKRSLTHVVELCVNSVGVNLNTASYHLLSYVSGIGPVLAKALVGHRNQKGLFKSRTDLLSVSGFSKKAFELAAGFLRIPESENPLDNTGVHPENYPQIEKLSERLGKPISAFLGEGAQELRKEEGFKTEVGTYTFDDMIRELEKPGRDPRPEYVHFEFRDDIREVKDLKPAMICPGIVTNVTSFGAFVDIGVHQDGLVHISQLSDKFIKDPKEVVKPGDRVKVRVLEVNIEKNQISLSMKGAVEIKPVPAEKAGLRRANDRPRGYRKEITREGAPGSGPRPLTGPAHGSGRPPFVSKAAPRAVPLKPSGKSPVKPKEAFNNPFAGLAAMRSNLKSK